MRLLDAGAMASGVSGAEMSTYPIVVLRTLLLLLSAGVAALVIRFGFGVGFRPLLNLIETLVISGIALFGFGFIGELLAGNREELRELRREVDRLRGGDG